MPDPFNGYRYFAHVRARWRLPVAALVGSLGVSLAVSLLLPVKYTAKVTLVIEPPAGSDPRAATAVSPIYLESLKTYEHFASSDQLFAQAVEKFQLRELRSRPIEKLKRQVLRVSIPRNTKVLEIAVTHTDPKQAHAVALYIAEETVKLNRKANRAGDDELIGEAQKELETAAGRLRGVESSYLKSRKQAPSPESLRAELRRLNELQMEVFRLALAAELAAAEQEELLASSGGQRDAELAGARERLRAFRSRAERLHRQAAELERRSSEGQKALAERTTEIEAAEAELEAARAAHEQADKRLRDLEVLSGYRGERLNLLDPGVVPERPSSPNLPLNLLAAAALALLGSLLYLTLDYSLRAPEAQAASDAPWMATRS